MQRPKKYFIALESNPLNDHLWIRRPVDRMIIYRDRWADANFDARNSEIDRQREVSHFLSGGESGRETFSAIVSSWL